MVKSSDPLPGYIYVLVSPNCSSVKVGRTTSLPPHRLREINQSEVYRMHGPWSIADVVQVNDSVAVETRIHRSISSSRNTLIPRQKELFDISLAFAREQIRSVPKAEEISGYPRLERCFFDSEMAAYLDSLFRSAGMANFVNEQGAWTLSLFTATGGGRSFTLNIGSHEVAYSGKPSRGEAAHWNFLMVDRLVLDFTEVRVWAEKNGGGIREVDHRTQRDRAVGIAFYADFEDALELFALPGFRRSLIAYWTEGLLQMRESGKQSSYKASHQWNAVAELVRREQGSLLMFPGDPAS